MAFQLPDDLRVIATSNPDGSLEAKNKPFLDVYLKALTTAAFHYDKFRSDNPKSSCVVHGISLQWASATNDDLIEENNWIKGSYGSTINFDPDAAVTGLIVCETVALPQSSAIKAYPPGQPGPVSFNANLLEANTAMYLDLDLGGLIRFGANISIPAIIVSFYIH